MAWSIKPNNPKVNADTPNIGFIGLGKLGLECAEVFAKQYAVRGFDTAPRHSDLVQIVDLESVIDHSDWIFVAVPTPHETCYDGSVPSSHLPPKDFAYEAVQDTLQKINLHATTPKHVVIISTVLPGTTRHKLSGLLSPQHKLIYNPYLIAMGSVAWDMINPEMIIIGTKQGTLDQAAHDLINIYKKLVKQNTRYEVGTWEECESIKIFYNTFITTKVTLVNMIQDFAMKIGNIDVDVVTGALSRSDVRITSAKYMTAGLGDAGPCHPRDNIALRWLSQQYDLDYDIFSTMMQAREAQARHLADFICLQAKSRTLPIAIHGKTYKPGVPYCTGSYSTLVAHYIKQNHESVIYIDPLADDMSDVVTEISTPHVILLAHNARVTYDYMKQTATQDFYCEIPKQSVLIDPWRQQEKIPGLDLIRYGYSRPQENT